MEIEFSGFYKKEIYFGAIRWIYQPSNRSMLLRVATFVIFGSLYIFTIISAFQSEGASSFEITRIVRHLITFLILGYVIFQPYINAHRKALELWNDAVTRRNITGRVSTIGVIIDPMKDWLTWEKFIKVNRTSDAITLLTASRMFVLLQRDFFKSGQDWQLLENIINSKVQEVIE